MEMINRDTPIPLKKYKTFGEIQDAPIMSAIQCITRMKVSFEKEFLSEWLFNNHYLKKKFSGNLTDRIKNLNNKICFNHLCKKYFNNFDINNCEMRQILPEKSVNIIKKLNFIQASLTGTFIDYLTRRIISEIQNETFSDSRAQNILHNENEIIYSDNIWKFNTDFTNLHVWNIKEENNINSRNIDFIQNNHTLYSINKNQM